MQADHVAADGSEHPANLMVPTLGQFQARLALRPMFAGTLANFMTATIAGFLL